MWLSIVALLVGAGADTTAEAAFKRMEQQLLKSKTLQVQVEITASAGKETVMALKGRLAVAQGDRARLELEGKMKGKAEKMVMVSDGKKMRMTALNRPGKDQDTKQQLGEVVLASLARTGIFVALFMPSPADSVKEKFDPEKTFPISDLKAGKKEMISGREAQVFEYKVTPKGTKEPLAMMLWVDVKTNLPVKRVSTFSDGKNSVTITETYAKAVIDGKLDPKDFALPK